MTYFTTCKGCKHTEDCEFRTRIKAGIKGLGITTVKHKCFLRSPMFLPGDPVTVSTGVEGEGSYGPVWYQADFDGVFIQEMKDRSRVVCFIKPGTEGSTGDEFEPIDGKIGFVKLPYSRVKKREGERIELKECRGCGGFPELTGKCGHDGEELYRPEECAMKKERQAA